MSTQKHAIDVASDDSFPASDPPSFTPVTGSGDPHALRKVASINNGLSVRVSKGRGEELRHHLASHGIQAKVSTDEPTFDHVEIQTDLFPEDVQAIVDQWE